MLFVSYSDMDISPLADLIRDTMKKCTLLILLLSSFYSSAQWTLYWADEFSGNSLDASKWVPETGGWGWGNNEWQYYTNGDNLSFANGELTITARQETVGGNNYTSGKIITKDLFEIQYGKVEARLKVPMGQGLWPAFWMLGENINVVSWPSCGEIDVMEHINNETLTHGTAHWNNGGHVYHGDSYNTGTPQDFHLYTIEWNAAKITWFVDSVMYHEMPIQNGINSTTEFHLPFYLILNLAVGGNWPGYPDVNTPFPSELVVDYVRAYKWNPSASQEELLASKPEIYPNPAFSEVNYIGVEGQKLSISSLDGKKVLNQEIAAGNNKVDVSKLTSGMYLFNIEEVDGSIHSTKLIKK